MKKNNNFVVNPLTTQNVKKCGNCNFCGNNMCYKKPLVIIVGENDRCHYEA
ncbi:MAG: hypothetical protein MJZ34_07425 [Paludibacteraceae bacterium]|nr:hypothetical protein [Paludibacteraceae bacterium]